MNNTQKPRRIFLMSWDNVRPAFIKAALELQNRGYEILYWVVWNKNELANNKMQFHRHLLIRNQHGMGEKTSQAPSLSMDL